MRRIGLLVIALALGGGTPAAGLAAQNAGDLMTVDTQQRLVLAGPRGGALTTLAVLQKGTQFSYGPMINGPGDGSALLMAMFTGGIDRNYVMRVDAGGLTTLSTFVMFPTATADLALDDGGDLLVLTQRSGTRNGLYRAPVAGASTLRLVAPWPKGAAEPVAFTERVDTGDWWILDQAGVLHLLARTGGAVLSLARTSNTSLRSGDLVEDPVTGDVLISSFRNLLRYDPATGKLTTILRLGVPQGGSEAMGLHFDSSTRGYLFTDWMGFGPGMLGFIHELDATGKSIRQTRTGNWSRPRNAVAAWGRPFTPARAPEVGKTYPLKLLSRPDATRGYQAAMAFTSRPGIPTALGPIPLTPDALFFLSVSGVPLFHGFSGTLSLQGSAAIAVDIPNVAALRGLRVVMAAVVFDGGGLKRILGPHGFTVR